MFHRIPTFARSCVGLSFLLKWLVYVVSRESLSGCVISPISVPASPSIYTGAMILPRFAYATLALVKLAQCPNLLAQETFPPRRLCVCLFGGFPNNAILVVLKMPNAQTSHLGRGQLPRGGMRLFRLVNTYSRSTHTPFFMKHLIGNVSWVRHPARSPIQAWPSLLGIVTRHLCHFPSSFIFYFVGFVVVCVVCAGVCCVCVFCLFCCCVCFPHFGFMYAFHILFVTKISYLLSNRICELSAPMSKLFFSEFST